MHGVRVRTVIDRLSKQGFTVHVQTSGIPTSNELPEAIIANIEVSQTVLEHEPCVSVAQTLELCPFCLEDDEDRLVAGVISSLGKLLERRLLTPEELTPAISNCYPEELTPDIPDCDDEDWSDNSDVFDPENN